MANFELWAPFSTLAIAVILIISRPDHFQEIMYIINVEYNLSTLAFCCLVILVLLLMSVVIWIVNSWLNDKKESDAKMQMMNIEKEALIKFFHAANGKEWTSNANWCGTGENDPNNLSKYKKSHIEVNVNDIQTWKGITCNSQGRVTKLILAGNNVKGNSVEMFTPLWEQLTHLVEIDLRDNQIEGPLPVEIALNLRQLQGLYLYGNRMTGKIPVEYATLPCLTGIYLFNNHFESIEDTKELFENINEVRRAAKAQECYVFI